MSFDSLGLSAELLRAIAEQGYTSPTPVQTRAIPAILAGHDLMAGAQTGTGKTAAFTLPMLHKLMGDAPQGRQRRVRALVLTPTRELAAQVHESVRTYGRHLPLRCAEVYGGVNILPQIRALRSGVDVLVATPGRLQDHLTRRTVDLSSVDILVLDEADRMLDMGFLPAIERILGVLPATRQTLFFSATFGGNVRKLAEKLLNKPQVIEVARANAVADAVSQSAYFVDTDRKRELLAHLIGKEQWSQVLVFTRTKYGADRLAKQLGHHGIECDAIHGDKSQGQRNRALAAFKRQTVQALIATDVAARGLDIDQLPHVVNFDLPTNPEDYVHRIGRTGRAGNKGAATSLVSAEERGQFAAIKRLVKTDIPAIVMEGFEPVQQSSRPRPTNNRRRPGGGGNGPNNGNGARRHARPAQGQGRPQTSRRPRGAQTS